MRSSLLCSMLLLAAGCGDRSSGAPCGIAALAGPMSLLSQFGVAGQTLSEPPARLPERLVARLAAGPALPAVLGRADSLMIVGIEGALPTTTAPQFGVLVVDSQGTSRGVMLYENLPVEGAPKIGTVSIGARSIPLIGIQLDPRKIEDPACPFFPDTILK
jgi:hypothetical protein